MILRRSPFTSCGVLKTVFPFILVCFSCHRCDSQYFEVRHTCRAPIIPHGHVVDDQFSYHTQFKAGEHAFTVCNEGYHLSTTNNTNVCQKNSKWAYSWPQCISIRCPSPLPIDYGDYTIKKTDVSSSSYAVLYHCFSGYVLVGSARLMCLQDSDKWQGTVPHCEIVCTSQPPSLDNGRFIVRGEAVGPGNGQYRQGSVAIYECDTFYSLIDNNVLTCRYGKWTGPPVYCDPLPGCNMPESTPHGYIIISEQLPIPFGHKVSYRCETNYTLHGSTERECLSTMAWSGNPPLCLLGGGCDDPGTPDHGSRCCQDTFMTNSILAFYCDEGYERSGSPERSCQYDGSWSGIQPTCYQVNSLITASPVAQSVFLNNTTMTVVIVTTGTVLGMLIIVILFSVRRCKYCSHRRRVCRSIQIQQMRHSRAQEFYRGHEDIDRVALIAYANGLEVVLPSYEEATASESRSRPPSFTESSEADTNHSNSDQASQFRRLPRVPRNLRLPPPPPVSSIFVNQLQNEHQNADHENRVTHSANQADVQGEAGNLPASVQPENDVENASPQRADDDALLNLETVLTNINAEHGIEPAEVDNVTNVDSGVDVLSHLTERGVDDVDNVDHENDDALLTDIQINECDSHISVDD